MVPLRSFRGFLGDFLGLLNGEFGGIVGGDLNRGRWGCFWGAFSGFFWGLLRGALGGMELDFPKSGGGDTNTYSEDSRLSSIMSTPLCIRRPG